MELPEFSVPVVISQKGTLKPCVHKNNRVTYKIQGLLLRITWISFLSAASKC